jgi:hypothetical protein
MEERQLSWIREGKTPFGDQDYSLEVLSELLTEEADRHILKLAKEH